MSEPANYQPPLVNNEDILKRYRGYVSRDRFWKLKHHPDFPTPVFGGPGRKQIYNVNDIDNFFANLRDGAGMVKA
jgi:hypothetical protein